MKKKIAAYSMTILTMFVPNLTLFAFLYYFRQLSHEQILNQTLKNPFYLTFAILVQIVEILAVLKIDKTIGAYKGGMTELDLGKLQKSIVKFPSLVLVLTALYSGILPQFILIGFPPVQGLRLDLTLLSISNLFLIGIPFYIFFIRRFEEYCSFIPFSSEHLSMSLSIRTLLVSLFSLFSLTCLVYLSVKVSSNVLGLSRDQMNTILKTGAPLVAFGVTLASVCIYLLMKGINQRIFYSQQLMKVLSQRDYSGGESLIPSRDELGVVIDEINMVRQDTGEMLKEIRSKAQSTIVTKENLVTVAEESSSAMTEMTSNIQSVGNSITNLDNNIHNVTSSMENLNQFIQDLTSKMTEQVSAQEESTAAIEEMTMSIENIAHITDSKMQSSQELQRVSDQGEAILKDTINQIGQIFESLDNIKSMTRLILNIASQTNMLAMNAAIEAAHAGDAGRGFSVVADEIRKLAETSSTNSKMINENIQEIVALVEGATNSGEKTTEAFGAISSGIRDTLDSLTEISTGMDELKTGGSQILGAVDKIRSTSESLGKQSASMSQETEKVNKAAAGLTQISAESKIAMDEMAVGAREVLDSSLSLKDHAAELDETSRELEQGIGLFKI